MGKPTFKQILHSLKGQVLFGKSYLNVAKGLLAADNDILQTAPTFFRLTIEGSLQLAQMAIARLYDDANRGSVTVRRMLDQAIREAGSFQRASAPVLKTKACDWNKAIAALEPVLASIKQRRNEWLAHLDPRTVTNAASLSVKAKLTIPDLERAFLETEKIILDMSSLYEGVIGDLRLLGADDFETALDWIRWARCTFIGNYEKEFGASKGPRPKECSGNRLKLGWPSL